MSESYTVGGDTYFPLDVRFRAGQTFRPQETHILHFVAIDLKMWGLMPPPTVQIFHADAHHKPYDDPISRDKWWVRPEFFPGQTKRVRFEMQPVTLEKDHYYIIVVTQSATFPDFPNEWSYDKDDAQYPRGIRLSKDPDPADWVQHEDDDHIFVEWGDPPAFPPPPPPPEKNFLPLAVESIPLPLRVDILFTTDYPCHLWLRWTDKEPLIHKKPLFQRGLYWMDDIRFCFVTFLDNEQVEPGDTLYHTFQKPEWVHCNTYYYYFHGTIADVPSKSVSPIFKIHYQEVTVYVISLGKFGDALLLHGHVKLTEGDGITITPDAPNNALTLSLSPLTFKGFGDNWLVTHSAHPEYDSDEFFYDRVLIGVNYNLDDLRVHTSGMEGWNYINPHTMRFWAIRDPSATNRPICYMAMVDNQVDLHNNRASRHIAFISKTNKLYASTGDNIGFTEVELVGVNLASRKWLKWIRTAATVQFWVDGILKATINTNVPPSTTLCRFLYQMIGTANVPRYIVTGQPRYSED